MAAKALKIGNPPPSDIGVETINVFPKIDGQAAPICGTKQPQVVQIPMEKKDYVKFLILHHPCVTTNCRHWSAADYRCNLEPK